jgi:hypothetical protein
MSNTEKQVESSLLWDCFTNWSLTLEKTATTEKAPKADQKTQ